jgi:dTMP kinase
VIPLFITLEGTEGSGKSSQIGPLAEYLRQKGYKVLATREPGGTPIGEQVRDVISNLDNTAMHPRTEILLFQASRAQLVEQVIRPHLAQGGLVLSDRYADSTLAYQGYGYQTDLQRLKALVDFATGGLSPDLTVFFDLDVEEGLRRRARGGEWNRLDALDLAFYQRVRAGYHWLIAADPARWVTIDASGTPEQVQAELRRVVGERLGISPG